MKSRHRIEEGWNSYWLQHQEIPLWDYMSQLVYEALRSEAPYHEHQKIIEVGCGTGRISLRTAKEGSHVTVIDSSDQALGVAKKIFASDCAPFRACQSSIFNIPFRANTFDVVWNAGVIEHFTDEERHLALAEMARICRHNGVIVSMNPNKYSLLYRLGKFISERLGKWPYGYEDPVSTLRRYCPTGSALFHREYSIGFFVVFVEMFRATTITFPLTKLLRILFLWLHRFPLRSLVRVTDRTLSKIFGGYLLVSTFRKTVQFTSTGE